MSKIELLSPAGTLKNMRYAFAYGATAVYAGPPRYSLRVRNNEFHYENLAIGIREAHELKKKFYVVINLTPHNAKVKTFIQDIKPIIELNPDAMIISDPGLIMLVRDFFPTIPIHLSVQANAVNWATVIFWEKIGLNRVILSRELSLIEIEEIRQRVPNIELEVFVHGAICMAYSGRCLISHYLNKRDPNQGACTNICRWKYKIQEDKDNITYIRNDKVFLIKNNDRAPYNEMTAFEDEHGTYIFNSKDLQAVMHIEKLIKIGVNSFKIEGRTKSVYYCARTAQIYRSAINDANEGKPFDVALVQQLKGLSHRGYTEGFLRRNNREILQNYEDNYSNHIFQQFVGEFTGKRQGELAQILVKNKFIQGNKLEIITPYSDNITFTLNIMFNDKLQSIRVAPGNGHIVWIQIPSKLIKLDFALLISYL
ncbi:MAG: tRNA 5-hydroxyuridine modification protein YegQ [Candidatus Dasytiphilus stammeri]